MKLIKNILCGVSVMGLMAAAANSAQASSGFVNGNILYVPLKLSVKGSFTVSGKHKTVNITETDILSVLGFPPKTTLAVSTENGDVWAVGSNNSLGEDLTADGFITLEDNQSSSSGDTQAGTVDVFIFSSPVFNQDNSLNIADSEADSEGWLDASGDYTLVQSTGTEKNGVSKETVKYTTKNVTGDVGVDGETGTGSASVSGSGSGNITP